MREIEFRGLNTRGEWVKGSLVNTTDFIKNKPKNHTKTWIVTKSFGNGGWFNIIHKEYVRPETVGQYTGMENKEGKELYEGDIISFQGFDTSSGELKTDILKTEIGVVKYVPSEFIVECNSNSYSLTTLIWDDSEYKIIGNIHESPELLEER